MKKLSLVLRCVSGGLVTLIALIFTVLEATLLVTADFNLYENEIVAVIQLVLKLLIAMSAGTLGVLSLVKRSRSFFPESICLLASTAVMLPFISNNFGIYITAVAALFALSNFIFSKVKER